MGYSIRSLAEVVTCLHKAQKRNYIKISEFNRHYEFNLTLANAFQCNAKGFGIYGY